MFSVMCSVMLSLLNLCLFSLGRSEHVERVADEEEAVCAPVVLEDQPRPRARRLVPPRSKPARRRHSRA